MNHLDLFSGIGGFAYAVDQVWPGSTHVFCDNNEFCQQVIKKHWPESRIYGDIRTITDADSPRPHGTKNTKGGQEGTRSNQKRKGEVCEPERSNSLRFDLLTGGFPCQPFSAAGKRRGTADDRYLWPEMLRVIQLTNPTWIIGENVGGFVTWNEGMVLQQVCSDLESEGYEVQPFIIPACAVNAPHRRDRVWIVANSESGRSWGSESKSNRQGKSKAKIGNGDSHAQDSIGKRSGGGLENSRQVLGSKSTQTENARPNWEKNWIEVATEFCGLDDGLSVELGEFKLTKAGHRVQQLKALGNAIVPQVAIEIMKAIKLLEKKE